MSTDVQIANIALSLLGEKPNVSDLAATDNVSVACNTHYQQSVDWVLKQREWRTAIKRDSISSPTTPSFGWTYAYALPADHLRTIAVRSGPDDEWIQNPDRWQQEGNTIVCDIATTIYIKYLYRVAVADIPSHIVDLIALRLASRLAIPITDSRSLREDLKAEYDECIIDAASIDGMQGRTRQLRASRILNRRRSGSYYAGPTV